MKLEIISGQQNVDLEEKLCSILKEHNISRYDGTRVLIFPERAILHPKKLYDEMKSRIEKHILEGKDLIICTYSDHVLNAARVMINKYEFENGVCRQFLDNGNELYAKINKRGRMEFAKDIFDVWDNALNELLGIN